MIRWSDGSDLYKWPRVRVRTTVSYKKYIADFVAQRRRVVWNITLLGLVSTPYTQTLGHDSLSHFQARLLSYFGKPC